MRFAFKTNEIRKTCEDSNYAEAMFGTEFAQKFAAILADFAASPTIGDMPPQDKKTVNREGTEVCEIKVVNNLHFVFKADHTRNSPVNSDGGIDWNSVDYIQILEIKINE